MTNPNEPVSVFAEHLSVDTRYRVLMNDWPLVKGATSRDIGPGRTEVDLSGEITDRKIQRWWVSHVNNDERTARVVEHDVTVDAWFARLPVGGEAETGTVTTDMLGPVDPEVTMLFLVAGERVGSVSNMRDE